MCHQTPSQEVLTLTGTPYCAHLEGKGQTASPCCSIHFDRYLRSTGCGWQLQNGAFLQKDVYGHVGKLCF